VEMRGKPLTAVLKAITVLAGPAPWPFTARTFA